MQTHFITLQNKGSEGERKLACRKWKNVDTLCCSCSRKTHRHSHTHTLRHTENSHTYIPTQTHTNMLAWQVCKLKCMSIVGGCLNGETGTMLPCTHTHAQTNEHYWFTGTRPSKLRIRSVYSLGKTLHLRRSVCIS